MISVYSATYVVWLGLRMFDSREAFIYQIVCITTGRAYIGSTLHPKARFSWHRHHLFKGSHHNVPLQRAWAKYGAEDFKFEVVENGRAFDILEREAMWISNVKMNGLAFNLTDNPDRPTHSYETCIKISQNTKGKKKNLSPEARCALIERLKSRKLSDETRKKMSLAQTGRKHSQESKLKMKANHHHYWLGKHPSDETRNKLSKATKGENNPRWGVKYSDELLTKLSISHCNFSPAQAKVIYYAMHLKQIKPSQRMVANLFDVSRSSIDRISRKQLIYQKDW